MLNLLTVSWPLQSYIVAVLQQTNNSGHRIFLWVHMQKCNGLQRKPQREGPWCPHAVAQRRSSFQAAASIFTDYVAMELPRAKRYQHSINVVSRQPGWEPTIWLHRLEFLPANEILPNAFSRNRLPATVFGRTHVTFRVKGQVTSEKATRTWKSESIQTDPTDLPFQCLRSQLNVFQSLVFKLDV